jgi:hypothetical protein
MPLVVDITGNDLTYKIIGMAMQVHNELGYGFKEEVYEKALELKLIQAGIEPNRQYEVFVDYEGGADSDLLPGLVSKPASCGRNQSIQSSTHQ